MIEKVGNKTVECRDTWDGYSIEVNGVQIWRVYHHEMHPEMKAEIAFSSLVEYIKQVGKL